MRVKEVKAPKKKDDDGLSAERNSGCCLRPRGLSRDALLAELACRSAVEEIALRIGSDGTFRSAAKAWPALDGGMATITPSEAWRESKRGLLCILVPCIITPLLHATPSRPASLKEDISGIIPG